MPAINARTLFHFTHSEQILESIISKGIALNPVTELIPGTKLAYSVNAACFCDIPLSLIQDHAEWYGKFAIGFNMSQMKKLGATPVLYAHSNSQVIPHTNITVAYDQRLLPFIKPICGKQRRYRAQKDRRKNYIDEKEWRIVSGQTSLLNVKGEDIRQIRADERMCSKPSYIPVTPNMIDYIIVEDHPARDNMINFLSGMGLSNSDFLLLVSKILLYNEIIKNF